jgi:hypothetical protein
MLLGWTTRRAARTARIVSLFGITTVDIADVAIATITRVSGLRESRAIQQSLAALADAGAPVLVADRGSLPQFVAEIRRIPGVRVAEVQRGGLVGQVQRSFKDALAAGRPYVLYAESDKGEFFRRRLGGFIHRAAADGSTGVVIAARTPRAMQTFPPVQRLTEAHASELCADITGTTGDYFYGPFLIRRQLARLVALAGATLGWGWRPFLFVAARQLGYEIQFVRGPYACPGEQRQEAAADTTHRVRQFADNARGLMAALQAF